MTEAIGPYKVKPIFSLNSTADSVQEKVENVASEGILIWAESISGTGSFDIEVYDRPVPNVPWREVRCVAGIKYETGRVIFADFTFNNLKVVVRTSGTVGVEVALKQVGGAEIATYNPIDGYPKEEHKLNDVLLISEMKQLKEINRTIVRHLEYINENVIDEDR